MFARFAKDRRFEVIRKTIQELMGAQGEANAQSMAIRLIEQYDKLDAAQQLAFFEYLAKALNPDPLKVKEVADQYCAQPTAQSLQALLQTVEPGRQELFRRINRAPNGTRAIVGMRRTLLTHLKVKPELRAIDADMYHLLSSWFNPGFLELHQLTWDSPARLLEKLIQHEAVHAIDGWDDLQRRLQPDRRCYAFFHPQLPGEPLIFVEVALVPTVATDVGVLIDKNAEVRTPKQFKAAIFYSISNCQPGLRGVSLGNFLIKRVAQKLIDEIPGMQVFSTLSPIPGFTQWLDAGASLPDQVLPPDSQRKLEAARKLLCLPGARWEDRLAQDWLPERCSPAEKAALMTLCGHYLACYTLKPNGDAVAKFHLSNGATLHQINWAADVSPKGLKQSAGIMVNYLYELDRVEAQHEAFRLGQVSVGKKVTRLL